MFIRSFEFEDLRTGWKLERTDLDRLNLLVGNSGVGKTKILRSLLEVAALTTIPSERAIAWTLDLELGGHSYRWSGRSGLGLRYTRPGLADTFQATHVVSDEHLLVDDTSLVTRDGAGFFFKNALLPHLSPDLSALRLLSAEPSIAPLVGALQRIAPSLWLPPDPVRSDLEASDHPVEKFADLQAISHRHSLLELALILHVHFPEKWQQIESTFCSIFPSVESIRVARDHNDDGDSLLALELHERSASAPIRHAELSSGMLHTLSLLITLTVASDGSVVLIDEFENSLGANCMPDVVRFLNTRPDLQFILTSHHPYVINNLPIATWKLVRRRGSIVSVTPAHDIPALQGASHHQAFVRLINAPEYEEGIS